MKIERIWAMPSMWTFTIPPIKKLLQEECFGLIADPFAGKNSPAHEQNDINEDCGNRDADHKDALTWLSGKKTARYNTVLFDPPYSITQARMYGKKDFSSMKYLASCKNEIARIIKPEGKAICFGWSSMGLGKGRGFSMERILLVPHGGSKNDTICTVEVKYGFVSTDTSAIFRICKNRETGELRFFDQRVVAEKGENAILAELNNYGATEEARIEHNKLSLDESHLLRPLP